MRISKSLMLGVAGSVLMAGHALAADPMPMVVATMPAAPAPVAAREVVVDISAGFGVGVSPTSLYIDAGSNALVDITSASGWGVRFDGGSYLNVVPIGSFTGFGQVTLYRQFGELELGVVAGGGVVIPGGGGVALGLSANYEHDGPRLYISSQNIVQLFPAVSFTSDTEAEFKLTDRVALSTVLQFNGFSNWYGAAGIDVDLTDRLEVWGNLYYGSLGLSSTALGTEFKLTDRFRLYSMAGFSLAPASFDWLEIGGAFDLTDALTLKGALEFDDGPLDADPFVFDWVQVWAELDRPIGTGPLSLTAELGVGHDRDDGVYVFGNIGFTYKLGVDEDHDDNRLFGDDPL